MTRDDIQTEGYEAWKKVGIGTIVGGTGIGKTKIGIQAVYDEFYNVLTDEFNFGDAKVLWLTNSIRLKEIGTPEDFKKWGAENFLEKFQIETIQTAYKWKDQHYDLVIVDEADFSMTPAYSLFFDNNTYSKLLCLTATISVDKKIYFDRIAPVVYSFSTQEAQQLKLLNNTQFVIVEYDLSTNKTLETGGNKKFFTSENDLYVYYENKLTEVYIELFEMREDPLVTDKDLLPIQRRIRLFINKRKELLWNLNSGVQAAKLLASKRVEKGHKVITFSKRTEQADKIAKRTYHSKNKKNSTVIEDFNSGKLKGFGVADAINRGENLVGLDTIVLESYDSSTTVFQQRHGRGTRLDVEDVLFVYILIPYYHKHTKNGWNRRPTQAATWANEMMKEFDMSTAKHHRLS